VLPENVEFVAVIRLPLIAPPPEVAVLFEKMQFVTMTKEPEKIAPPPPEVAMLFRNVQFVAVTEDVE
jgi:hypothetical protein